MKRKAFQRWRAFLFLNILVLKLHRVDKYSIYLKQFYELVRLKDIRK